MMRDNSAGAGAPVTGRWFIVGQLFLLYSLSFVDRFALSVLAQPVTESLSLTDTQLGLLFGLAFGVLYALCGLPIAHFVDKANRVLIVTVGVALWSLATVSSGFAATFWQLFLLRCGVAIGEAVLSPAAVSIIADLFERNRRTLPTSIYNSAAMIMGGGAFLIGGLTLSLATRLAPNLGLEPWRVTLTALGIVGLVLSLVFWATAREPARVDEGGTSKDYSTAAQAAAYLWGEGRLFTFLFVATAGFGIAVQSVFAWTPTLLVRAFGETPAIAAYLYGTASLIGGVTGAVIWPTLSALWTRRGRQDEIIILFGLGAVFCGLSIVLVGVAPTVPLLVASVFCMGFFGSATALLMPLIIQNVAPAVLRGRLMATYLMAATLVGLAVGPSLTALISEHCFHGTRAIGSAIAVVGGLMTPIILAGLLLARRRYIDAGA